MSQGIIMENWTQGHSLEEHAEYAHAAHVYGIESHMVTPPDNRFAIAHALPIVGGKDGLVVMQGYQGTGKTALGTRVMGTRSRRNLEAGQTAETLFGYPNPINANEFIPGELEESLRRDQRAFLNEMAHIANTGPLHDFAEERIVLPGGRELSILNIAFFATANYPDGRRNKDFDPAMRSRLVYIPTGDISQEQAAVLQGRSKGDKTANGYTEDGLIPQAEVRGEIRSLAEKSMPVDRRVGPYIVSTLAVANSTGLFTPVEHGDNRISRAWQAVEHARRLISGDKLHKPITPFDLADTAALRLGGLYRLNENGELFFEERLEKLDGLTSKEKQMIVNRAIAVAGTLALRHIETSSEAENRIRNQSESNEERMRRVMKEVSYFDAGDQTEAVDDAILEAFNVKEVTHAVSATTKQSSRSFFGRYSRR